MQTLFTKENNNLGTFGLPNSQKNWYRAFKKSQVLLPKSKNNENMSIYDLKNHKIHLTSPTIMVFYGKIFQSLQQNFV